MIKKGTHQRPTLLIFPKDLGKSDNSTLQDKLHAWQRVRKTTSYCLSPRKPEERWLACRWQLLLHSCHHLPACLPPGSLRGDPPKRYSVFFQGVFSMALPIFSAKKKISFWAKLLFHFQQPCLPSSPVHRPPDLRFYRISSKKQDALPPFKPLIIIMMKIFGFEYSLLMK